jgi:hypothetical protein
MVDARGRPYFLWDDDLTIDMFARTSSIPIPRSARISSAS